MIGGPFFKALLPALVLLGATGCDARPPAGEAREPSAARATSRPLPPLTGRVVDRADVLAAAEETAVGARLEALEKATGDQVVVVTVPSLEGEPIDALGRRLGNGWGIGRKGLDNGMLLIVAPADRKARIEVGKGLEGLVTERAARKILDERVIPACREGRCDLAIASGIGALDSLLRSDTVRPRRKRGQA